VKPPPKSRYEELPPPPKRKIVTEPEDEQEDQEDQGSEEESNPDVDNDDLSSVEEDIEDVDIMDMSEDQEDSDEEPALDKIIEASIPKLERKRKRNDFDDDLEGKYMEKLAKEEEKEEAERKAERRLKRQRLMAEQDPDMSEESEDLDSASDQESEDDGETLRNIAPLDVPVHEFLALSKDTQELEKATRTVFLANVSTLAMTSKSAKKTLLAHMGSFLSSLPRPLDGKPPHKVESLRFRSTAYAGTALPKKAAFAKKDLMAATTKSTNAYVVYSNAYAAREAAKKLNGTVVLDRHLRVDGVAHPAKTDHRRCVFVGNLGFVDDESMLDQGGENERKRSKVPSDIEEGLWRQFSKAGAVESVRVVRDEKTRVGKGFAYVQFVVSTKLFLNQNTGHKLMIYLGPKRSRSSSPFQREKIPPNATSCPKSRPSQSSS
jgi:nucleolar protein 12